MSKLLVGRAGEYSLSYRSENSHGPNTHLSSADHTHLSSPSSASTITCT